MCWQDGRGVNTAENMCLAKLQSPDTSPLKGLYCTMLCILGPETKDAKVTRPKGSCPCKVHNLVGTKKKNISKRSHQRISPCSGYYAGKGPRENPIQGRVRWGGRVCVREVFWGGGGAPG